MRPDEASRLGVRSLRPAPYIGTCETSRCGTKTVVLTGAGTHCHVPNFADPISIKAVACGEVEWRLGKQRYLIHPDTLLLLPDGDEYALTIDSVQPSRGFCVLFRRGLVEESCRAAVSAQETLLDLPYEARPLPFRRRLESRSGPLGQALDALAMAVDANASADTVGWLDGRVIGKPEDEQDARRILRTLSGRVHELWTGVCLWRIADGWQLQWQERTLVRMRPLSDGELDDYLATRQWVGCSGAYAIKEDGDPFLTVEDGSLSNVIGLPMESLERALGLL